MPRPPQSWYTSVRSVLIAPTDPCWFSVASSKHVRTEVRLGTARISRDARSAWRTCRTSIVLLQLLDVDRQAWPLRESMFNSPFTPLRFTEATPVWRILHSWKICSSLPLVETLASAKHFSDTWGESPKKHRAQPCLYLRALGDCLRPRTQARKSPEARTKPLLNPMNTL